MQIIQEPSSVASDATAESLNMSIDDAQEGHPHPASPKTPESPSYPTIKMPPPLEAGVTKDEMKRWFETVRLHLLSMTSNQTSGTSKVSYIAQHFAPSLQIHWTSTESSHAVGEEGEIVDEDALERWALSYASSDFSTTSDYTEQLRDLRQSASVCEYIDTFNKVLEHLPQLPTDLQVSFFVAGLKDDLKARLSHGETRTLAEAERLALDFDRERQGEKEEVAEMSESTTASLGSSTSKDGSNPQSPIQASTAKSVETVTSPSTSYQNYEKPLNSAMNSEEIQEFMEYLGTFYSVSTPRTVVEEFLALPDDDGSKILIFKIALKVAMGRRRDAVDSYLKQHGFVLPKKWIVGDKRGVNFKKHACLGHSVFLALCLHPPITNPVLKALAAAFSRSIFGAPHIWTCLPTVVPPEKSKKLSILREFAALGKPTDDDLERLFAWTTAHIAAIVDDEAAAAGAGGGRE